MTIKNVAKKTAFSLLVLLLMFVAVAILLIWIGITQAKHRQVENRIVSAPKTGFFVKAYDTQIFIQKAGANNAPAVVFVHGTGAWSEIWRPYMSLVASMGYQTIGIDLPPFGYSLPPASGNYNKTEQAKRILSVLDSLGIKQASFVSHSIGSSPLMEALLTEPQRVTKLVMISPALGLDSPLTNGSDSKLQHLLRTRWLSESVSACIFTNPLLTKMLVQNFVAEKDKVTDEWVDIYRKPLVLSDSYQSIALWLPELMAGRTALKSDNPESYKTISFPVTLIWGTDDHITPLSQGERLHLLIPDSNLKVLSGGHVPMIEEPEQFGLLLTNALTKK